jgi:apolipoprotein N-acyltransferase
MNYFYGIMWLLVGLILIFSLHKENKIFYFIGAYFLFLGIWWIADAALTEVDLFDGMAGIIFRIITGVVLLVILLFYYLNIWKPSHQNIKGGK